MRPECLDRTCDRLVELEAAIAASKEGVHAQKRVAQRGVPEHNPACGPGSRCIALRPVVQQGRIEIQDLVRPALGHRRHAGVHGLGFEHEQLPALGALLGRVELEARGAMVDDRHRPGRM